LGPKSVPSGSLIAVFSDLHIPYHDASAVKLAMACCNREGVTHVVLNGDIADSGVVSKHDSKAKKDSLDWVTLKLSAKAGLSFINWARSKKRCVYIHGNHEAWVEKKIELDPGLKGAVSVETLLGWPENGDRWTVLPSMSKLKIGTLNIEHGDGFFKSGSGGMTPARTILRKAPNQTTIIGHLHREDTACYTVQDERGVDVTRIAYTSGHLSLLEAHADYMGNYPGWQQSFKLVRVFWVDGRAKYTVYSVVIFRDSKNRPAFEFNKVHYGEG
jgi:predicted phosphodiesterase